MRTLAANRAPANGEEGIMKIFSPALLGVLALSLLPALAQQTGRIHGRVINYTGQPQPAGLICLSTDNGVTVAHTFPVDSLGNYAGEAPAATYTLVYRMPDTPPSLWIDAINNITITAGKDLEQNDDMSRQAFIDELPDEQKKELENLKKQNAAAQGQEGLVKTINADLTIASQDLKESDTARTTAIRELGKTANATDIDAKAAAIKNSKCAEVESLMLKDLELIKESGLSADESTLWENLGRAQIGLKKFDEAEKSYKQILAIQTASGKPNPAAQAFANAGLGEIYARTGNAPEAAKAFDLATQLDPSHAAQFLKNEALAFLQTGDAEAQVAAADKAIKADPRDALAYYIKANGLLKKSGVDLAAKHYDLPPGCAEAYQKYLSLTPNGPYAAEAQAMLRRASKGTTAAK
ncbi:MAG: tetratricopeptide repeat protein [Terracidiphilus sp.]